MFIFSEKCNKGCDYQDSIALLCPFSLIFIQGMFLINAPFNTVSDTDRISLIFLKKLYKGIKPSDYENLGYICI